MKISIIGCGRLGTSLTKALKKKKYSLVYIYDADKKKAIESKDIIQGINISKDIAGLIEKSDLIFITVPDKKIREVVIEIVRINKNLKDKFFFHTSGIYSSKILKELKGLEAKTGVFHPVQSFPTKDMRADVFKNIFFTYEGDAEGKKIAEKISKDLGGELIEMKKVRREKYHLACSIASNLLLILFKLAVNKIEESGLSKKRATEVLTPLAISTLKNINEVGIEKALTGPLIREDIETLRMHIENLNGSERDIYKKLIEYFIMSFPTDNLSEKYLKELGLLIR
ncbi:MAG: DUF2520 domain-containing protein [Acidobacteriota bacterium]